MATPNNVQKHYIKLFNAQQSGYNINQGGQGFSSELNPQKLDPKFGERNSMFGRKHTEQVKQRISTLNRGRLVGEKNPSKRPEVREKLKQAKLGLNNPRGCIWKLISPQGQETIINGGIKRALKLYGLSYQMFVGDGKIRKSIPKRAGWTLQKLT